MSIEQTDKVDFISISPDAEVVLTISDHLSWDEDEHLPLLQDKINAYLGFIQSEQLLENYPAAEEYPRVISVVMKFDPSEEAVVFLTRVMEFVTGEGIEFRWKVVNG